jgi:hypothetical protein
MLASAALSCTRPLTITKPRAMSPTFEYSELNTEVQEVRVAVLLAGKEADDIVCSIYHYPLQSCPPYEALSYAWGDQNQLRSILLDRYESEKISTRQCLSITSNLEEALRHLRLETRSRTLWIDAVCINQSDTAERDAQVSMMREIYSKASRTVVYLGPETEFSAPGMAFMEKICGSIDPSLLPSRHMRDFAVRADALASHPLRLVLEESQALESMVEFFTRPWWSRVWIVQELSVSQKAICVWGKRSLPWEFCTRTVHMFDKYIILIRELPEFLESTAWSKIDDGRTAVWAVIMTHGMIERSIDLPLSTLLEYFWLSEATEPQDNVYALLGIATDSHPNSITPQYSLETGSVFGRVVHDLQIRAGNLDVLSLCSSTGVRRVDGLPTWAPDWTRKGKIVKFKNGYHTFPFLRIEKRMRIELKTTKEEGVAMFSASGEFRDSSNVVFSSDFRKLYLAGVVVDTISELSPVRSYLMNYTEMATIWGPMGDSLGKAYASGGLVIEAFDRTLSIDQLPYQSTDSRIVMDPIRGIALYDGHIKRDPREYEVCVSMATSGRRFMLTEGRLMGLAVFEANIGDLICVLDGVRTPMILRQDGDHFLMVGECYRKYSLIHIKSQRFANTLSF